MRSIAGARKRLPFDLFVCSVIWTRASQILAKAPEQKLAAFLSI